jgi:uncharacterized membrane-anchored protein YhcB (DUF1043 family)
MELTLNVWLAFGTGLVLGAVCIFFLQRRMAGADRERAEQMAAELEVTREELEAHREEVAKHFQETSQLFRGLTEQYTRLYAHLAEGAREFCADEAPALARGFDGPLLGRNGDDAAEGTAAAPGNGGEPERARAGVRPAPGNGGEPEQTLAERRPAPPNGAAAAAQPPPA